MKISIIFSALILLFAGCNNKVYKSQIDYDKNSNTILYNNKPYTGTIIGENEESYWSAEVKDGKLILETETYPNGYKEVKYVNGVQKFFNDNDKCISQDTFQKNITSKNN